MKKKGKLVIGTTMILLFAAGFAVLRNDHFVQEETQESTAQTESDAQAEEVAQTASRRGRTNGKHGPNLRGSLRIRCSD
ncbi:hypothetical protein [Enterococcus casseliflavus]